MTDIITTLINEARTPAEFGEAARMVKSHLESNRNPDDNAAHVAHLSYRGHAIMRSYYQDATLHPHKYEPAHLFNMGDVITERMMDVLAYEPRGANA